MLDVLRSLLLVLLFSPACALAQTEPPAADSLEAKSLPLRTALYHDPTLLPPIERLLQLYREAGREKEIVETYRQHVAQYPADIGALTVLVRLLAGTNDPDAARVARTAAEKHPDNAFLQYLLFEQLQKTRETGALNALERAITKETHSARKRAWIEQLLPLAAAEGRPELATKHLESLAAQSRTAEEKLDLARKMISHNLHAPALAALEGAAALTPSAETGVDIELASASAELGLEKTEAAAARLDRLLGRLAADYWRRPEILHRRTALVKSDAGRSAMLNAARTRLKAAPADESTVLEAAQLLAAFEFRREALDILLDASRRLPASEKIEKAALDLFDRLRDERGREAFLAERLKAAPQRQDLALTRTRSLFLLNRRAEALALFDQTAAQLDPATRLTQMLELARFLRRSSLPGDAAKIFQRAVELAPARLEIRRELAETWLAVGDKEKARALFAGTIADDVETENLLDVVQFLLKQELFTEAHEALAKRVAREPQNFDLRLTQLTVAARMADDAGGQKLIAEIRALVDTDARYRRWLEGAVAFHERFERHDAFLTEEQARLAQDPNGWSPEGIERRLAYADVAAAAGRKAEVAAMFNAAAGGELAPEIRVELRRRQLGLIESDAAQSAAVEEQLKALLADDPARADEYRIRLALLYSRMKRSDQVAATLGLSAGGSAIDVQKITDASLLTGLETVLREFGGGGAGGNISREILERLTVLEPANRGAWERWLTVLATGGDEERLRSSLRRLIAGIDKLTLTDETRALLQDHLVASHWRSLHLLFREAETAPARLSEALPLLDSAERLAKTPDEWTWIAWTRAYTLNRLGQREARDAAIQELDRVVLAAKDTPQALQEDVSKTEEASAAVTDGIAFPDGLVIGLKEARELLTTAPSSAAPGRGVRRQGPQGKLRVRWAFDTDRKSSIATVQPMDAGRVLVTDAAGRVYAVDAKTGKLLWSRDGVRPITPQPDQYGNYRGGWGNLPSNAQPVSNNGRLFFPAGDFIECWSQEDGRLLWRAAALRREQRNAALFPSLFIHRDQLLVCDPVAPAVGAFDTATGKLLWQRDFPAAGGGMPLNALNAGAAFSDGRVLLYGAGAFIVSAVDGALQWAFDSKRVREFPISLSETPQPVIGGGPAAPVFFGAGLRRSSFSSFSGSMRSAAMHQVMSWDYASGLQPGHSSWLAQPGSRLALLHSAAAWAARNDGGQSRFAALDGVRLLIFNQMGMRSLRLDLPFAGVQSGGGGTFLGFSAGKACLLNHSSIGLVDSVTGVMSSIPIEVAGASAATPAMRAPTHTVESSPVPVQAALDGPLVYVSGPVGVASYQVRTGERVQQAPWPESLQEAPQQMAHGLNFQFVPQGRLRHNPQGGATIEPIVTAVHDGAFYTTSTPWRLVAFAGEKGEHAP